MADPNPDLHPGIIRFVIEVDCESSFFSVQAWDHESAAGYSCTVSDLDSKAVFKEILGKIRDNFPFPIELCIRDGKVIVLSSKCVGATAGVVAGAGPSDGAAMVAPPRRTARDLELPEPEPAILKAAPKKAAPKKAAPKKAAPKKAAPMKAAPKKTTPKKVLKSDKATKVSTKKHVTKQGAAKKTSPKAGSNKRQPAKAKARRKSSKK